MKQPTTKPSQLTAISGGEYFQKKNKNKQHKKITPVSTKIFLAVLLTSALHLAIRQLDKLICRNS